MKFGNVVKSADSSTETSAYSDEIMEKVNRFTRKKLTSDEVYIFPVIACDNEIDRDCERFSVQALQELAEKFIGKTVICDHDRKNTNQTARIFDTEVIHTPTAKTSDGEELHQLKCQAYMLKNDATKDVIDNIEAGIYKEVSVGCAVSSQVCSICGKEYLGGNCNHIRGDIYNGRKCFITLSSATDAYELSFVAVPAQPGAGVTKWYKGDDSAKKKGLIRNMNYDEAKKALADMGIDLDGIAKTKGELPPIADMLDAVKKKYSDNVPAEFITAEEVKSACGKDMTSADALDLIKSSVSLAEKGRLYDEIKDKAVSNAVKCGVKAKGENFSEERYRKIFEGFSVDEINAQAAEWDIEAKSVIKTGRTSEDTDKAVSSFAVGNLDDYKI